MAIDLGDVVPLTVDITDAAGVPANAGAITLTITLPDGTTVTPSVSNPTTGRYQVDYLTTQAGRHVARWVATGSNASAHEEVFNVAPGDNGELVSLSEVKLHLNIALDVTTYDEEIRDWIPTSTAVIERHTGKRVYQRQFTERHRNVCWADELWLRNRPCVELISIATADGLTSWPVTSSYVDIDPDWGVLTLLSGARWHGRLLKVVQKAGMAVVPDNFSKAARIITGHLWEIQRQPGVGPAPTSLFGEGDVPVPTGFAIPSRALELLGPPGPMVA